MLAVAWANSIHAQSPVAGERLADAVSAYNRQITQWAELRTSISSNAISDNDPLLLALKHRGEALEELIEIDPARALSLRLPDGVVKDLLLRAKLKPFVERFGTWKGPVEVSIEDRFDVRTSRTLVSLLTASGKLGVFFSEQQPELACGQELAVEGMVLGTAIAVAKTIAVSEALMGTKGGGGCSVLGEQKIAVILVEFGGASLPSFATPAYFEDVLFSTTQASLRGFWEENSGGLTWAAGDAFGPYTINPGACNSNTIYSQAIAAADGVVDFTDYSRVFVIIPEDACGFWGLGTIGCTTLNTGDGFVTSSLSLVSIDDGDSPRSYTIAMGAHEGGHNLTLRHANSLEFGNSAIGSLATAGTRCEYGGIYSIMGALYNFGSFVLNGHYTAQHKAQLGWSPPNSGYLQVETSGKYLLRPVIDQAGVQGLRFRRGAGNNLWLWLEYRQFEGDYDTTLAARSGSIFSGALIHYEDPAGTEPNEPRLLDFQPGVPFTQDDGQCSGSIGSNDFHDVTLPVSATWSDPYTNSWIRVDSADGEKLAVSLGYGADTCDYSLPESSVVVGPSAGNRSVAVTGVAGCGWNAVSDDDWITVSSPTFGTGNGTLAFSFAANFSGSARVGGISLADVTLTVTQLAVAQPDLVVSALNASTMGTPGGTVTVSATVRNEGGAAAGPFQVAFYFSVNGTLDGGDARSATTCSYGGLGAGVTNSAGCSGIAVNVPGALTPGSYTLFAKVDDLNAVAESNESNNGRASGSGPITVGEPGSVSQNGFESGALLPWKVFGGATAQAKAGAARTGAFGVEISGGGGFGGVFQDISGLTPGQNYQITAWVRSPAGSGTASLWVHDTTGGNVVPLLPAPGAATYRRMKLDYRANGTGKARVHLVYNGAPGTVEWDDISVVANDAMEFGFESGALLPWKIFGGAAAQVKAGAARRGSFGVEISGGGGFGGVFQDVSGLTPGQNYQITAWVRSPAGSGTASLWVHDTTGGNVVPLLPAPGAVTYRRMKLDYRANATGKARVHLVYNGAPGTVEWDDISVVANDAMEFGCESGAWPPWKKFGATSTTATPGAVRTGSFGLELSGVEGGLFFDLKDLTPGATYEASVWVRGGGGTAYLWLHDTTGSNWATTTGVTTGAYQQIKVNYTANATGKARLHLRVDGGPGLIEWDDVSFRPL